MNINQIKNSRYLSRGDVGGGILVTIKDITQEDVAMEGEPEKLRWCMGFVEKEKKLVLNTTNAQLIAQYLKSEETDNWIGHKVVLYDDPTIAFGGKLVGGIRARAPKNQASKPIFTPPPPPVPAEPEDASEPF